MSRSCWNTTSRMKTKRKSQSVMTDDDSILDKRDRMIMTPINNVVFDQSTEIFLRVTDLLLV